MKIAITGAASGIGRACALEFTRRGHHVIAIDRDCAGLDQLAVAESICVDLTDRVQLDALARDLPHVDVLFNNAGVAVIKPLADTTDDDWKWLFDINVWAPIRLTRAMLGRADHFAFTASLAGLVGAPGLLPYSASKHALVGFADALRAEAGVPVTVICPGYIPTGLHRATRYANPTLHALIEKAPPWMGVSPERAAHLICTGILRRDPQIVFGIEKLAWYVQRISPALAYRVLGTVSRLTTSRRQPAEITRPKGTVVNLQAVK